MSIVDEDRPATTLLEPADPERSLRQTPRADLLDAFPAGDGGTGPQWPTIFWIA